MLCRRPLERLVARGLVVGRRWCGHIKRGLAAASYWIGSFALLKNPRAVRRYYATGLGTEWMLFRSGMRIFLPPMENEFYGFLFKEIFIDGVYNRAISSLPQSPTVVDLGANVGFFTLKTAASYPGGSFLCVEPDPRNFGSLERNIGANSRYQITALRRAVGGKSEERPMFVGGERGHSSFYPDPTCGSQAFRKSLQVVSMTLDELFELERIERCDLLKLDCEGAEYEIFASVTSNCVKRIDRIVLEYHEWVEGQSSEVLKKRLEGFGFKTQRRPEPNRPIRGFIFATRQ